MHCFSGLFFKCWAHFFLLLTSYFLFFKKILHTIGGPVGLQEIRQPAFLDGGIPTQGLLVQGEQEAVELHQELVQHCRYRQRRENSLNDEAKWKKG